MSEAVEIELDARKRLPLAKVLPRDAPRHWRLVRYDETGEILLSPLQECGAPGCHRVLDRPGFICGDHKITVKGDPKFVPQPWEPDRD